MKNIEDLELTEEELQNVLAGNSEGMSEITALEHPELFRTSQIEQLQEEQSEYEQQEYEQSEERQIRRR